MKRNKNEEVNLIQIIFSSPSNYQTTVHYVTALAVAKNLLHTCFTLTASNFSSIVQPIVSLILKILDTIALTVVAMTSHRMKCEMHFYIFRNLLNVELYSTFHRISICGASWRMR